jgi:hypothetical protein
MYHIHNVYVLCMHYVHVLYIYIYCMYIHIHTCCVYVYYTHIMYIYIMLYIHTHTCIYIMYVYMYTCVMHDVSMVRMYLFSYRLPAQLTRMHSILFCFLDLQSWMPCVCIHECKIVYVLTNIRVYVCIYARMCTKSLLYALAKLLLAVLLLHWCP